MPALVGLYFGAVLLLLFVIMCSGSNDESSPPIEITNIVTVTPTPSATPEPIAPPTPSPVETVPFSSTVGLILNPQDPELAEATERAAEEWARYGESIQVRAGRGVNVQWNPELNQDGQPVAAAVFEAGDRIEVNSTMYRPGLDCLWCALFHEIGHLLGYKHGADLYGLAVS